MRGPSVVVEHAETDLPTVLEPSPRFPFVAVRHSPRTVRNAGRLLFAMLVLTVVELVAFGTTYLVYSRYYVSTDNAQVDSDKIEINAPASGLVVRWGLEQGSSLRPGETLGMIRGVGGGQQPNKPITAPDGGTVAVNAVANGSYVQQGQTMAVAFNPRKVYVTARVPESDIGDVEVGDQVDVHVDAYPGTAMTGVVEEIRDATAARFAVYPSAQVDPTNVQKVDQYVPVRIATYPTDVPLYPGLDVTVDIRISR